MPRALLFGIEPLVFELHEVDSNNGSWTNNGHPLSFVSSDF